MRRRALLAASVPMWEEDEKVINTLRIVSVSTSKVVVRFDYPPASGIILRVITAGFMGTETTNSYYAKGGINISIALGPGGSLLSIEIVSPLEDDIYIYKVAL